MSDALVLERVDGPVFLAMRDDVTALYAAVHHAGPQGDSPLYARETFLKRTNRQAVQPGFAATLARHGAAGELAGFAFGLPFPSGVWWASHRRDDPPVDVLEAPKFAVIELNVAGAFRGRGLARRLLDLLLTDRPEPFAILTTTPDSPARSMYARWGWKQIGTAQHTPEAPCMDQLVLPLRGEG
ncbi:GNAT family N-acetyltransferase [Plantactinospora sp. WMMC1484]|uniref:GNAT family N-acetyltransferase n=1 Tax=Plantactinospora sp. WMMC1484 TaxID=3404122 RepID=UPI003BF4963D